MIESRCGIKCSDCSYKGRPCPGPCVENKKIFWGKCEIKDCCEGRGLENCGQCADFVCQKLHDYAYDKDQGDNGLRLENCRLWCRK